MVFRNHTILARVLAVLMAALVALPASGLGQLLVLCTMTGEVGLECCCQHDAEAASTDGPSVSSALCCEALSADPQVQPTRIQVVSSEFETPQFVALAYEADDRLLARAPTGLASAYASRGPPPDNGPSLFIKHCSFLI